MIVAGVISLALAIFMYHFKSKAKGRLKYFLLALRFLTLFAISLLIINPKFQSQTFRIEKPHLLILVDNSASVKNLNQHENVLNFIEQIKGNKELQDKFEISFYSLGSEFRKNDSFSFDEKNTNIESALRTTADIYKNHIAPVVLLSDGNQTFGMDYEFVGNTSKNPIFPVVLGDTTQFVDLKLEQLNTNRYAFLKNQFPVEVLLSYNGKDEVSSEFVVYRGESVVYRNTVHFSEKENSRFINFNLEADRIGMQTYVAEIKPLDEERNTTNNRKPFAVEVVDEGLNVLIVSSIIHPDIGALKNAITSNEQRKVSVQKPAEALPNLEDNQLIILYQPDQTFRQVFEYLEKQRKNYWVFTGQHTNWNSLNNFQSHFIKKTTQNKDLVQGKLNSIYASFAIEDIHFSEFPPLYTLFGNTEFGSDAEFMLFQTVHGLDNENPLMATIEKSDFRIGLWDGDAFWRWRADSFRREGNFQKFDDFIGNIVQYLASNKKRNRLEVASENFYYNNRSMKISAQYFDKNYVFDTRGNLKIVIKNSETEEEFEFPMLLKNNYYEVDLGSLEAGKYDFTVSVSNESLQVSQSFTILDFDVEQQFLNADVEKLTRLGENSSGKTYLIADSHQLLDHLLNDNSFKNIQKTEQKTIPLIDWKYLLAFIVVFLSAEWFLRKYHGLV